MDGNKPMFGKIGERIKSLKDKGMVWAPAMAEKHAAR
jgi:hypothetical protein